MANYIRQGSCNWCGECCGAGVNENPWPSSWFRSDGSSALVGGRPYADLAIELPILALIGRAKANGTLELHASDQLNGSIKITGRNGGTYYFTWIAGTGLCKDISASHDGSAYETECPFLKDDPGDGTRPCGLVDTKYDAVFRTFCINIPREIQSEEDKLLWEQEHPSCSYTWVPE